LKTFSSLSSRAVLLTGAVAAITVLIAGIVAFPLVKTAAQDQAQATLASQANLVHNIGTKPNDFDIDNGPVTMNPQSAQCLAWFNICRLRVLKFRQLSPARLNRRSYLLFK